MKLLFIFLTVFNFAVKTPENIVKGGIDADFIINIKDEGNENLLHWDFEYQDGKKWVKAGPGIELKKYKKKEIATLVQSFTVKHPSDSIRVRVSCSEDKGSVSLQTGTWGKPTIVTYPEIKVKDSKRIALVGNSFTFFYASDFFLKRLARLHGHQLDMSCSLKGGQCLQQHTQLERTKALWENGPYDIVIFQDQSQAAAKLASNPSENQFVIDGAKELTKSFLQYSPSARIIYECTWSYEGKNSDFGGFESLENFDKLLMEGSRMVLDKSEGIKEISPIGKAFDLARKAGFDLYFKDNKHQGALGAYLKSCVNFLLLFGEPFDENLDLSCGIDATTAKSLREIATKTVIK